MDRIDHYPGCEQPNDEQEGKAAGQIAALRDQQETFYYRNDAVYRTQEINKKEQQTVISVQRDDEDIGVIHASQIMARMPSEHKDTLFDVIIKVFQTMTYIIVAYILLIALIG